MLFVACCVASPVAVRAGTGKVPVEGALAASNVAPESGGEPLWIYFNATPLEDRDLVTLEIKLPQGVTLLEGQELRRSFREVAARTPLHLAVAVTVTDEAQKDVFATATLARTEGRIESRAFHVVLNAAPSVVDRGRPGTSAGGNGIIIYDAGP